MICQHCGAKITQGATFCADCGIPVERPAQDSRAHPTGLIGWSARCNDPEILAAAQKNKKSAIGCAWIFTLLFPVGFLIAGLLIDELPLVEAVVIGAGLGVMMLFINLLRIRDMKKPVWEGVVTEKYQKERREYDREDNVSYYTEFVLVMRKDTGKKIRLFHKNRRELYDYFAVGDRVRFHTAFNTYEKYDKSKDKIIYCNVCSMTNPITNDRCKRCKNPLFK
jgi:hypothetical protein